MSQALYTSKTGISAGQTQVDVIANNVANINTTAYKSANVTFSTLFSKTLSSGSAATTKGGGTNPKQIGLGTQVASISRDFTSGSFQPTSLDSDFMISGNGYFVVQDADNNQYFTRDGHFSLDSDGNLTISNGYKVVGTSNSYSNISGNETIKVATQLNATVSGTDLQQLQTKVVSDLNCVSFNRGKFVINVGTTTDTLQANKFTKEIIQVQKIDPNTGAPMVDGSGDPVMENVETDNYIYDNGGPNQMRYNKINNATVDQTTRQQIIDIFGALEQDETYYISDDRKSIIRGAIPASGTVSARHKQNTVEYNISAGDLSGTVKELVNTMNNDLERQCRDLGFDVNNGEKLEFAFINGGFKLINTTGKTISVGAEQGCNFLNQTGLDDALDTALANQTEFYSSDINKSVIIRNATSYNDAASLSDWNISEGGVISATYSDGSSLTVMMGENDKITWKFLTPDKVTVTGSGAVGSDIDTSAFELRPDNMILEMASVINDGGLLAQSDNLWTIGPNAGEAYYGVAGGHGMGILKSGGLEGSNVDMSTELSNMIMAQRAIQANSRVFNTASSILETLAYLGQ